MAPEKGPKRKPTLFPPPPIQIMNAEFEGTVSTSNGRANVHQQGSTVSVSAPEANLASPAVATAPTQRNEEEPQKRRPGRPRKNPLTQPQGVNTAGNQRGEPKKRGRPRKTVPDPPAQNRNESPSRESAQGADTSRNGREVPKKRGPGRPRKAVPDHASRYEEVYNDEDMDGDYIEDEHGGEVEGFDRVSLQSDEGQETLTRRTRSQASRVSGRTKSSTKSRRSTRREIALRNHDKKLDDALEREKTRLKARHSFMTKEVYEAPGMPGYAGPDPAFNDQWDADDEASLIQTYWQGTPLEHMTSLSSSFTGKDKLGLVFRASLHVFKVDPLTLFTMGLNDIVFVRDAKSSTMIDGRLYTNPFWTSPFCEKLARIIYHPLWYGPEPWAFMLFAIKWAVICRTDDRRPLHQDELLLLERNYCEMRQDSTLSYPKIHAKQQRIVTLRGGVSSPQAQLLSEIAKFAARSDECSSGKYYHIITGDLTAVIHGLDSLRSGWMQDCEFYYQMFAEAQGRELYPSGKEMPALYKNCYLSVERKKLYDFKVHGHDLVYFEEHHLRIPSKIPQKLHSSSDMEELEEEIPPEPLRRSSTQPDADPFDETAPGAADVDRRGNEDSHNNNPQVIESSDYEDFIDHPGNFSDLDPGEEAEPPDDLSPQIPQETSEQNEAPQDVVEPPAASSALRPITRLEPCSPTSTFQRNPEEDGAPRSVVQDTVSSAMLPQYEALNLSCMKDRPDVEEQGRPICLPQDMSGHVHGAQKRKNSGDDPMPRKAIRREEVPHSRLEQSMAEPSFPLPDHLDTVDAESQVQPLQSLYDSSGRLVLPSLSDSRIGKCPNPAARKQEGYVLSNPFSFSLIISFSMADQNDKDDLRNMFDEKAERRHIPVLLMRYPPVSMLKPNTSGLDCLAHLIRHCNAMLSSRSSSQLEEKNPLLRYTWKDFRSPRDQRIDRKGIDERMNQLLPTSVSFEDYSESDLMNSTIWSSREWTLPFGFITPQNGQRTLDQCEDREELAKASLIEFDCRQNKDLPLQEAVDSHLLEKYGRTLAPRPPNFLRVRYYSHPSDPLPFSSLVTFKLEPIELKIPNDRVSRGPSLDYSLVAVVRMRSTSHGRDYIRTYIPVGCPVKLEETHIVNHSWGVQSEGKRFMLVYAQCTRNPGHFVENLSYHPDDIGYVEDA
ncbi:uncharacterized protein FTOL_08341 [Fusarium torulosum]|uniref:Uncharacterized protein n=1 Tax=Fusarium torulosum TaxID=33205 RepID=A0AAE8MCM8_9HYPO|nr:uncharacterized protein FTOL_08341 [Fusarium torulosum]